jgi:hypothetical protein
MDKQVFYFKGNNSSPLVTDMTTIGKGAILMLKIKF